MTGFSTPTIRSKLAPEFVEIQRKILVSLAINGNIVRGLGAATNLIEIQRPRLRDFFPAIDECQIGTINVQLNHALDVRIPDIVTPPIAWQAGSNAGERFAFTKIEFEFLSSRYDAWIYGAEFSVHRFNYNLVEVVARPIQGISPGRECVLHIERFTGYIVV
jgi:hypothetical protein